MYQYNGNKQIDIDLSKPSKLFTTMEDDPFPEQDHIVDESSPQNYVWTKVIGQGTFGTVYKAQEITTGKTVAIKKVFQDPKYRNREFSIVSELNHENAIKIHNYFFTKGEENPHDVFLNIVMDYIPETLYRILRFYNKQKNLFPNILGRLYAYQLFRSLAYIHAMNVCHRDIKPQNIQVDTHNHRLVLCDFGSAKKQIAGEASIAYICSRYYRAPELILGAKEYGCEIDVWSIGCVIAEMFLGEPIFAGNSNKEQFQKIVQILGVPTAADYTAMGFFGTLNMPMMNIISLKKKQGNIDPLALDLLSKLLTYDPKKRLLPFAAQHHPYFDHLRQFNVTVNGRDTIDLFNFKKLEIGKHQNIVGKLIPEWYHEKKKLIHETHTELLL